MRMWPKAYGSRFVYLCICVYVRNLDFSEVAKNQALVNAVQAQHDNISNLIVLDYCDLLTLNTVVACSRLPGWPICSQWSSLHLDTRINTTTIAADSKNTQ